MMEMLNEWTNSYFYDSKMLFSSITSIYFRNKLHFQIIFQQRKLQLSSISLKNSLFLVLLTPPYSIFFLIFFTSNSMKISKKILDVALWNKIDSATDRPTLTPRISVKSSPPILRTIRKTSLGFCILFIWYFLKSISFCSF